jgi:hypothetical protein
MSDAGRIIIEACMSHGVTPDEILDQASQFTFGY